MSLGNTTARQSTETFSNTNLTHLLFSNESPQQSHLHLICMIWKIQMFQMCGKKKEETTWRRTHDQWGGNDEWWQSNWNVYLDNCLPGLSNYFPLVILLIVSWWRRKERERERDRCPLRTKDALLPFNSMSSLYGPICSCIKQLVLIGHFQI